MSDHCPESPISSFLASGSLFSATAIFGMGENGEPYRASFAPAQTRPIGFRK
jgi:hypothetical protein